MRTLGVYEYEEGKLTTEERTRVNGFLGVHGMEGQSSWKPIQVEVSHKQGFVEIEAGVQFDQYMQDLITPIWRIAAALEKLAGIDTKE